MAPEEHFSSKMSRAWGFPSADSDYDIRFIYAPRLEWYRSIDAPRDVIERQEGELDFSGWELRKALRLFRQSNPPLYEWLGSPVVYLERGALASRRSAASAVLAGQAGAGQAIGRWRACRTCVSWRPLSAGLTPGARC